LVKGYKITGIKELAEKETFKTYKAMLSKEDLTLRKAIEKVLLRIRILNFSLLFICLKNRVKHILLLGKLIKNGEVVGAHGNTQDVTEKFLQNRKFLQVINY
jgi:hypothetical protein